MGKKRKIDFVLEEDEYYKIVFRFYPRQSSCHSFGDEPPKNHDDIYKVYYYYRILRFWKEDDGSIDRDYDVLFDAGCDECSIIDEIGHRCLLLANGEEVYKRKDGIEIQLLNQRIYPFGMGVEWIISKHVCTYDDIDDGDLQNCENMEEIMGYMKEFRKVYYTFMLFEWCNRGFKFTLEEKDVKAFGEYLLGCCEYMLAHGDPI